MKKIILMIGIVMLILLVGCVTENDCKIITQYDVNGNPHTICLTIIGEYRLHNYNQLQALFPECVVNEYGEMFCVVNSTYTSIEICDVNDEWELYNCEVIKIGDS